MNMNNGFPPPPGQYPSSHQLPQPQQPAAWPQQPMPQQPMPQGGVNVAQGAAQNTWAQMLAAPPRQQVNRARAPDGNHVVRFTADCKLKQSQQDMQWFMAMEYMVVESSVPQAQGQVFSTVVFFKTRMSLQEVADMGKMLFGQDAVKQFTDPMQLGAGICQKLASGFFALVNTYRSPKQVAEKGYDNAFVNHRWSLFFPQQMTLAQAMQQAQLLRQQAQGAPQAPQPQQQMPQPPQQQWAPPPAPPQQWAQPPAPQQMPPAPPQQWAQPPQAQVFIPPAPPGFPPAQPPF